MLSRALIAALLSCCWLLWGGAAGAAGANAQSTEAIQRFDQLLTQLRAARALIDDSQFDLPALLDRLDYDPDRLVAFVRDEIRFEPYAGLLRGADGVLQSRAGNSLDQSVLLAVLLTDAGVDVRIAQGRLSEAQARALVRTLAGTTTPAAAAISQDNAAAQAFAPLLKAMSEPERQQLLGQPVDMSSTTLWPAMLQGAAYLTTHLQPLGVSLEPALTEDALVRQSRDYYWVQYRDSAQQPWVSAHTLPPADTLEAQGLEIVRVLEDSVPDDQLHRLRITMKLERRLGGQTQEIALMTPWERPVANMAGKRITLMAAPDAMNGLASLTQPQQLEQHTKYLLPLLNGSPAPGAQAFDFDGQVISLEALKLDSFGASEVFKQLASQTARAADALAGLSLSSGKPKGTPSVRGLQRVWVEYTLLHPDGTERTHERTIWHHQTSPPGVHPVWPLSREHAISVNVGQYAPAYLMARNIDTLLSHEALLRHALAGREGTPSTQHADSLLELQTHHFFDMGAVAGLDQQVIYRAEPSLLVTRQGLNHGAQGMSSHIELDVIHNRRVTLNTANTPLRSDPALALRVGIWETLVEQATVLMQPGHPTDSVHTFPSRVFMRSSGQSAPLVLPSAAALDDLPQTALPADSRRAVAEDLARGYMVALDIEARPGEAPVWWRVDPRSGETLGRGLDGRGVSFKEYLTAEVGVITALMGTIGSVASWGACEGNRSSNGCSTAGCIGTGAVYGLAVAVASALATATLIVKAGVDVVIAGLIPILTVEMGVGTLGTNLIPQVPSCLF